MGELSLKFKAKAVITLQYKILEENVFYVVKMLTCTYHKLTFSLVMSAGKTFVDYSNFAWFFVGSRLGCRVVAHFTWKLEQQV